MADTTKNLSIENIKQIDLWRSGEGAYDTYRIPALCVTKQGSILAFCEGRRDTRSDTGKIDLMIRRSTDNGETWSEQELVRADGEHTCGNPAPVVDQERGTIFLLMTWNRGDDHEREIVNSESKDTRRVFVLSSDDDGLSWSDAGEITSDVKHDNWTWYATGPVGGIQMTKGNYAGRLVIPCDHIVAGTRQGFSHVIYSDDHGATWQLGGTCEYGNESTVVELSDGRLLLNMRNYDRSQKTRLVAYSKDGGETWDSEQHDKALIEPICQASLRRYKDGMILFSNPAHQEQRLNMTLRLSLDDASTWALEQSIYAGASAYSDLAVCPDGKIACLYECGNEHPYERITLALFDLKIDELK